MLEKENIKKAKKNRILFKLKKVGITLAAIGVIGVTGDIAHEIYTDVNIPTDFSYTGAGVSSNEKFDFEKNPDIDFLMIEANNWNEQKNSKVIENIKNCDFFDVPCAITVNSNATTVNQAKADAACLLATIEGETIDGKINFNIDNIVNLVDESELTDICKSFIDTISEENYSVALSGKNNNLKELSEEFSDIDKMVISDDKGVGYNGTYSTCYFTRTGKYYSNVNYNINSEIEITDIAYTSFDVDNTENTILKGIDVSKHQGKIDWEKVKAEGVSYAILRISSFHTFHSDGNPNIDTEFYRNISECQRLGIPCGIYAYTTADTVSEAKDEAWAVVNELGKYNGLKLSLPVYYDIEMDKHYDNPENCTKLCHAFMNILEENGYVSAVYASYSLLKDMIREDPTIMNENNWVAYYKNDKERDFDEINESHIPKMEGIGNVRFIQISEKGIVKGINSNYVDLNITALNNSTKTR